MTNLAPGAFPQRQGRTSQLLFGWLARHGSIDAYTGQAGALTVDHTGSQVPLNIFDAQVRGVAGGHAMPRFERRAAWGNLTTLWISQYNAGEEPEKWQFPWPLRVMALTAYVKVFPGFTAGSAVTGSPWLVQIGNATTAGGYLGVRRLSTNWQAIRFRGASNIESSFVESGSNTYPIEVLVTFAVNTSNGDGTVQLSTRNAAGTVVTGSASTGANYGLTSEAWGGQVLGFGAEGAYGYQVIKIARGVKTMDEMVSLS